MGRIIGGIVAGIISAFVTIWLVDMIGHLIYPLPADLDLNNRESLGAYITAMPPGALLFVAGAWFLGALDGGIVAVLVSRRRWTAWLIAALVACAALANVLMIPHPFVLQVGAVVAPLLGGLIATRLARSKGWDEGTAGSSASL